MGMTILGKCVFIFCIVFMMCPKRVRPALAVHKLQQDYYHARRGRGVIASFSNITNKPTHIKNSKTDKYRVVPDKTKKMKGSLREDVKTDEATTGFDLTNEEIIKFKIWPRGVIPYYIDVLSFKDKVLRDKIRGFLNIVNEQTGLNFLELHVPPEDEKERWVFFVNRRGLLDCADHSIKDFTNQGVQQVILGYDCMITGGELAEVVLAIAGLPPQHNAPNRDEYIKVAEDNIVPDKKRMFEKLNDNEWLFHDIAYDFNSAGHYHSHKYSINGRATIETQDNYVDIPFGEGKGLSNSDILKIRMLYSYISKKKLARNIPECHKLFQPGKNFNSYIPYTAKVSPLKKPNKYVGLEDEAKSIADDEFNNADDDKDGADDDKDGADDDPKDDTDKDNEEKNDDDDENQAQSKENYADDEKIVTDNNSAPDDYKNAKTDNSNEDENTDQEKSTITKKEQKVSFVKPGDYAIKKAYLKQDWI